MTTVMIIPNSSESSKFRATCCNCFTTFNSRSKYLTHYCYSPGTYVCTTCWTEFKNVAKLYYHLYQDAKECMGCSKRFGEETLTKKPHLCLSPRMEEISPSEPIKHKCFAKTNSEHKCNLYKCLICSYAEIKQSFECCDCPAKFSTGADLKCHIIECHKSKYISYDSWVKGPKHYNGCVKCWKKFGSVNNIRENISVSGVNKVYICKKCWKELPTERQLEWQIPITMNFQCTECWRIIKSRSGLSIHLTTHKSYQCTSCPKQIIGISKFNRHVKSHLEKKLYPCEKCSYASNCKSKLNRHMMCHLDVKPYKCKYCDYRSSRNSRLQTHVFGHIGVKPFKCEQCDYSSTRKDNLRTHKRTHTRVKISK